MVDDAKIAVTLGRGLSVEEVQKMHAAIREYIGSLPSEMYEAAAQAALLKGIRLGLEAAAEEVNVYRGTGVSPTNYLTREVADILYGWTPQMVAEASATICGVVERAIRALDPNTIAKDA